ncbi:MAG: HU family DNA-binding protein, partial [Bacteroidales bacterium]|nr:HU family DNA-binding protein [Bacteroidales bacterium]
MNKKQLVKKLSQKTGLTLAESNDFLNSVLDIVSDTLK